MESEEIEYLKKEVENAKIKGWGTTPLHWAAQGGHHEMVKLLLSYGANIEAKNISGFTPLYEAVRYGQNEVIKVLLKRGANINALDDGDYKYMVCYLIKPDVIEPFLAAEDCIPPEKARWLLNILNTKNKDRKTLCLKLKENQNFQKLLKGLSRRESNKLDSLVKKLADDLGESTDNSIPTLSTEAGTLTKNSVENHKEASDLDCEKGHAEAVKTCVDKKGWVDYALDQKYTLSQLAAEGAFDFVKLLLDRGADIEGNDELTPLHLAVINGHFKVVKLLLERGANKEAKSKVEPFVQDLVNDFKKLAFVVKRHESNQAKGWASTPLHFAAEIR